MKIAFVHDWLVYAGGAEKVFFDIIKDLDGLRIDGDGLISSYYFSKDLLHKFNIKAPIQAEIFTTFYNPNFKLPVNLPVNSVLSGKNLVNYYRNFFPVFPFLQRRLSKKIKKFNPDLIIISSFAVAKNIDVNKPKILYLHSPMQYIWSHYKEYLYKFSGPKKLFYKISSFYLRKWDKKYREFDYVIANSNYTKDLAKQIYNLDVNEVIFPKVEIPNYKKIDVISRYGLKQDYFLYIGRVVRFVKHLDKLIEIFNKKPSKQLVIVGDGPDIKYLKSIAGKNIKFLGYISSNNDDYWNLVENSKAVINLTKESFGIVNYQVGKLGKTLISINDGAISDIPGKKFLIKKFEELEKII